MAVLEIITAPDPRLKTRAPEVREITDEERQQLDDLLDTMYAAQGIGLAAVQVGIMKRMLVLDVEQTQEECHHGGHHHHHANPGNPMKFINPEITWASEEPFVYQEGCLSFPSQYADVERPAEVKVKYLDESGKAQEIHAKGLLAVCLQHEIDHLDGITFVDHISRLKRDMILRKMKKMKKTGDIPPKREHNPYVGAGDADDHLL